MITFTTPASVNGVAQEGQLLTAVGEVDDPTATITYQWQENISGTWTDIPGNNALGLYIDKSNPNEIGLALNPEDGVHLCSENLRIVHH